MPPTIASTSDNNDSYFVYNVYSIARLPSLRAEGNTYLYYAIKYNKAYDPDNE